MGEHHVFWMLARCTHLIQHKQDSPHQPAGLRSKKSHCPFSATQRYACELLLFSTFTEVRL